MKSFWGVFLTTVFTVCMVCYIALTGGYMPSLFNEGFYGEALRRQNKSYKDVLGEKGMDGDGPAIGALAAANKYKVMEEAAAGFLNEHLLGVDGEIFTNLKDRRYGMDTLSESVGLLMDYCVLNNDKDLFHKEYLFLKKNMLAEGRFVKWKYGSDETYCNAAIDDLRIVGALLDAYKLWGEKEYLFLAGLMQKGMLEKQIVGGNIREFYDWKQDASRDRIPLCYIDLYTLDRLSTFNEGWEKAADNGLKLIKAGSIQKASPFFYKYYDYSSGLYSKDEEYEKDKSICLTYTLYTAIHLSRAGEDTQIFTRWLKSESGKGRLYAWYNPDTQKPSRTMESTAVYALAAVYAKSAGENELYYKLLDKMLEFMVTDKESIYYGGFGFKETGEFYSFDNLTALWALAVENGK